MKLTQEKFEEFAKTLPLHEDFIVKYEMRPDPNVPNSHTFMIVPAHLRKSKGVYLDPSVHPCGTCIKEYDDAVHRQVWIGLVAIERDTTEKELSGYLNTLKETFAEGDVDIAGFGFPNHKTFRVTREDGTNVFA